MPDPTTQDQSALGQKLLEDLVRNIAANTTMLGENRVEMQELRAELSALRDDIAASDEGQGELTGLLTTIVRVVDHVAGVSSERPPEWSDVKEILLQVKKEAEEEPDDPDGGGDGSEPD